MEAHNRGSIYLIDDEFDIGKLMHDFNCTQASDMVFPLMAEKTKYLKENPKGVSEVCKQMEDLRNESFLEGKILTLIDLVIDGSLSIEKAAAKANMTVDEFKEAMDKGFIKGDTVQIVRKNGKIHDYVLDGERVEPHEILSLEKVSDIIKELGEDN